MTEHMHRQIAHRQEPVLEFRIAGHRRHRTSNHGICT